MLKVSTRVQTLQTRGRAEGSHCSGHLPWELRRYTRKTGKCAVLRSLSVLVRIDEYLKFGPVRQPLLGVRGTLCIALTRACASLHINFETGASLRKLVGSQSISRGRS